MSVQCFQQTAKQLLSAGIANKTRQTYQNGLRLFKLFRTNFHLNDTWPVPIAHLTAFLSYLFESGYAPASAASYLSAISFYHKINNLIDNTSNYRVDKTLEGFKRLRPTFDTRIPVMYETLLQIISTLSEICSSMYEVCLFRAAYTMAFFGLFRVGELVASSSEQADTALQVEDVSVHDIKASGSAASKLMVRLKKSKTSQYGASVRIPICQVNGNACPVGAVIKFLNLRVASSRFFFCHLNGKPLTRYQFGAVLTKCVNHLGLPSRGFRTHSFRIGAASWLAKKGVSDEVIKRMGRWKSQAFKRYIRL